MLKRHFINLLLCDSPEVTLLLWKREYPIKLSWLVSHLHQNHSFPLNRERGFPGGASGKEPGCQCRRHKRHRFHPWVRKLPWRRAWQSTPVSLPGESRGERSLGGCSPWGCQESDMTEVTELNRENGVGGGLGQREKE